MAADPLKLRTLPTLTPPDSLWDAIALQLDDAHPVAAINGPEVQEPNHPWMPLALAASVVAVAFCLALLRPTLQPESLPAESDQLRRLRTVSAALELQLDSYRDGVFKATTVDAIARREQELAWLDVQLQDSPDDAALWAERVVLLSEMVERYMSADWRSDMGLASY